MYWVNCFYTVIIITYNYYVCSFTAIMRKTCILSEEADDNHEVSIFELSFSKEIILVKTAIEDRGDIIILIYR